MTKIPRELSELEETFALQLRTNDIKCIREYPFDPNKGYKADFFFPENKLIVEINGGTWMAKSGHSSGSGIARDYEKANAAQLLGFMYLQFTGKELDNLVAIDTVKKLLEANNG